MGAVSNLLETVMELVQERRYREALDKLTPWRDDAPNQLWGVMEFLAADNPPELPSEFLPWQTGRRLTSPDNLRELADSLEDQGISGLNVALAIDLIVRDYSAPNN